MRKLDARTQIITTIAGTGDAGFSGDGGRATAATMNHPSHVAIDAARNILYISDRENFRIRKVTLADGIISTIAGGGSPAQGIGDGGLAREATLSGFTSVAVDAAGNLIIADHWNSRVRRVDAASQIITTVAGGGNSGEDNILATDARLEPMSVAVDNSGNMFILDYPSAIRKVNATTGKIVKIAGGEKDVLSADNGPALQAAFNYPRGIALDGSGNLYIADSGNNRIRAVRGPIP